MQNLSLVGLSHKTAPIEIREKVFIPSTHYEAALARLCALPGIVECLALSTCNRTEIYVNSFSQNGTADYLTSFLSEQSQLPLDGYLYRRAGLAAVDQIMRVAAGLDSMIVGEGQVLGQVKDAFALARGGDFTGPVLNALFNRAICAGKRARAEAEISAGAVSISSAAVELARRIFEDFSRRQILIIGAGKMSELAVKQLIGCGVRTTLVSNRTYEKAKELAARVGGEAVRFDEIKNHLARVDIVISSTGAPHVLIRKDDVARVMAGRKGRPLFFIDIALPRDIDPAVAELDDVFLYDIDDLGHLVRENMKEREKKIPAVEMIIEEEKAKFVSWCEFRRNLGAGQAP